MKIPLILWVVIIKMLMYLNQNLNNLFLSYKNVHITKYNNPYMWFHKNINYILYYIIDVGSILSINYTSIIFTNYLY